MVARREGALLLLLSAAGYACLPILAKWAYAAGLAAIDLVTWRFILATPLIWLLLFATRGPRAGGSRSAPTRRRALFVMGFLFACLALTAFTALTMIPSSTYTVLLYTYPALVTLFSFFWGERLSGRGWVALGLTMLGVALTVPDWRAGLSAGPGLALALLNATLYAVYIVLTGRLLQGQKAMAQASAWTITGALCLLGLLALWRGLAWPVGLAAWGSILALATISTVLPIFTFYAGMQRVGAARASIISTVEPLITLLLAMLLLGEVMGPRQWLGGALILSSVILLQWPTPSLPQRKLAQ